MPRVKRTGIAFGASATAISAVLALFSGVDGFWPIVAGCAVGTVVSALTPMDDRDVPNHPMKLPFFAVMAAVGMLLLVAGIVSGPGSLAFSGAFLLALAIPAVVVIRRGRNPWWLRGWLDYRDERGRPSR